VGDSLRENIEQLRLSQDLATIREDLELDAGIADLSPSAADTSRLRELYGHFELRSLLGQLDEENEQPAAPAEEPDESNYETVLTWDAFNKWFEKIDQAELTAFDTETTSINYMQAEIVGPGRTYGVRYRNDQH